jgi:UDP-glucose 4-epimerase
MLRPNNANSPSNVHEYIHIEDLCQAHWLARQHLGWTPAYPELATIVKHAWGWEQR